MSFGCGQTWGLVPTCFCHPNLKNSCHRFCIPSRLLPNNCGSLDGGQPIYEAWKGDLHLPSKPTSILAIFCWFSVANSPFSQRSPQKKSPPQRCNCRPSAALAALAAAPRTEPLRLGLGGLGPLAPSPWTDELTVSWI